MTGATSEPVQVGTQPDMVFRLRSVLPSAWFPLTTPGSPTSETPVLDGILAGIAAAWTYGFNLLEFVRAQTRLSTMSGSLLDLFAGDFFGTILRRRVGEGDLEFSARVRSNLLVPRATRQATIDTLRSLTSLEPEIFEPGRASDTGGYGSGPVRLGSAFMPFQSLVTINASAATARESEASYLDQGGKLSIAPRHVLRPLYARGAFVSNLIEQRGYNLIKDSVGWSGFQPCFTGAVAQWTIDSQGVSGLWAGQPTLRMSVTGAGQVSGPAVSAYTGSDPVSASAWVRLPAGHSLTSLNLVVSDGTSNDVAAADLTVVDGWQRLVVGLGQGAGSGRSVTLRLGGAATGAMVGAVVSQCWQIEPGGAATSYIPSVGQIGVRDGDVVTSGTTSGDSSGFTLQDVNETLGRVMPAGSIAWVNVQQGLH